MKKDSVVVVRIMRKGSVQGKWRTADYSTRCQKLLMLPDAKGSISIKKNEDFVSIVKMKWRAVVGNPGIGFVFTYDGGRYFGKKTRFHSSLLYKVGKRQKLVVF